MERVVLNAFERCVLTSNQAPWRHVAPRGQWLHFKRSASIRVHLRLKSAERRRLPSAWFLTADERGCSPKTSRGGLATEPSRSSDTGFPPLVLPLFLLQLPQQGFPPILCSRRGSIPRRPYGQHVGEFTIIPLQNFPVELNVVSIRMVFLKRTLSAEQKPPAILQ